MSPMKDQPGEKYFEEQVAKLSQFLVKHYSREMGKVRRETAADLAIRLLTPEYLLPPSMEGFRAALDKTFRELERVKESKELKVDVYMITLSKLIYLTLKDAHAKGHKCCEDDD